MGDFSNKYIDNTKSRIFISQNDRMVSFKPFIDSFSFSNSIKYESPDASVGDIFTDNNAILLQSEATYKVGLDVVSTNVKEAIENHKNFQILLRMMAPILNKRTVPKFIFVKFSNLISKDGGAGLLSPTAAKIQEKGAEGLLKNLSYQPDMELGFFEYNGIILAKSFKMELEIVLRPSESVSQPNRFRSGYPYRFFSSTNQGNGENNGGGNNGDGSGGGSGDGSGGGSGETQGQNGGEGDTTLDKAIEVAKQILNNAIEGLSNETGPKKPVKKKTILKRRKLKD